jgi:hypothetical protein
MLLQCSKDIVRITPRQYDSHRGTEGYAPANEDAGLMRISTGKNGVRVTVFFALSPFWPFEHAPSASRAIRASGGGKVPTGRETDRRIIDAIQALYQRIPLLRRATAKWQYRNIVADSTGTRTLPVSWAK